MTLAEASILIVDDEPVLRMTFAMVLKQTGATVHAAEHGLEALAVLDREQIDLLLTDKHMPQMDGLTLLRTLHERGRALPTILFVNSAAPDSAEEIERLGVAATVAKPLHPSELTRVLQRVLTPIEARTPGR